MAGGSGAAAGGPGSGAAQLNGKTIAEAPIPKDGYILQRLISQNENPAETAARQAAWRNVAMGLEPGAQTAAPNNMPSQNNAQIIQQMLAQRMMAMQNGGQMGRPSTMPMMQNQQGMNPTQMIRRSMFNPQAAPQQQYAMPRPVKNYQPQVMPPQQAVQSQAQAQSQPTEMDQRLKTLEEQNQQLRNWSGYRDGGGYA